MAHSKKFSDNRNNRRDDRDRRSGENTTQEMSEADFARLAKSLNHDHGSSINVPAIAVAGVIVALIALSFLYSWPLWASLVLIVMLGMLVAISMAKRPPVAPLELTAAERQRVERVVEEHGVRPAIALVRALYPTESPASANRTVKIVVERMLAAKNRGD